MMGRKSSRCRGEWHCWYLAWTRERAIQILDGNKYPQSGMDTGETDLNVQESGLRYHESCRGVQHRVTQLCHWWTLNALWSNIYACGLANRQRRSSEHWYLRMWRVRNEDSMIYMHSMHQPKGKGWRSACPEARACRRVRTRYEAKEGMEGCNRLGSVSYTHLTLPTSDLV